jgi:serine phosphatase RsbU (regulator of sigma subunit)
MSRNQVSENAIDKINEKLWAERFTSYEPVLCQALKNLKNAELLDYSRGIANAKLSAAAVSFLNSRNDDALRYLADSLQWFSLNKGEKGYLRAMLLEGNIHESFGNYDKALFLCLEALKASKEQNEKETEAEACNQLGLVYSRLRNYDKSLEYLNSGLKLREEMQEWNAAASSLNRIGMVLRQMKKYEESLEYYFKSLEIRKKNKQTGAIPWTLLGIASTCEESGRTGEALRYYLEGLSNGDQRCTLQCRMGAGRIYSRMGEKIKAEELLFESLKIARELNAQSLVAEAYSSMAAHYESAGESEKALKNFHLYQETRESLLSEEAQSRLRNVEVSHAIEKSEQEKEIFRLKNVELKKAYEMIAEKNKDITDSISYAKRIQNALLPDATEIRALNGHLFILYLPKDVISGDFYWFTEINGKTVIAAGDCTGHGVPGALMSMLGISFLDEIVNKRRIENPGKILDELGLEIQRALRQHGENDGTKDGMDISVCVYDNRQKLLHYSGANNSMYLVREGQLTEYKADRMPAGYSGSEEKAFTLNEILTVPGDIIYMFSDGYADQFGGANNKKFKYSAFKELLLGIHRLPLNEQRSALEKAFISWRGENTQVDDVMILGFILH